VKSVAIGARVIVAERPARAVVALGMPATIQELLEEEATGQRVESCPRLTARGHEEVAGAPAWIA